MKKIVSFFNQLSLIIKSILLILVLTILFLAGDRLSQSIRTTQNIQSETLLGQLTKSSDLISTTYHYKLVGVFENNKNFYGVPIPFTSKKFIVSHSGTILAGINLSEMTININHDAKKLSITLPEPKILANDFDPESIEIFDEQQSVFNPISINDYQQFAIDQEKKAVQDAIDNGLYETTTSHAKETIIAMLTVIDDKLTKNYHITFR